MDRKELVEMIAREISTGWYPHAAAISILDAIASAGLVIVPEEPSEAMASRGYQRWDYLNNNPSEVYRAMIAAGKVK